MRHSHAWFMRYRRFSKPAAHHSSLSLSICNTILYIFVLINGPVFIFIIWRDHSSLGIFTQR